MSCLTIFGARAFPKKGLINEFAVSLPDNRLPGSPVSIAHFGEGQLDESQVEHPDVPPGGIQLTGEQREIIAAVSTGRNILVAALAGTGKTSTLLGVAKAYPDRKGLYLAYNKALQLEARAKFLLHKLQDNSWPGLPGCREDTLRQPAH
jgi:superfamily II DNA or RNA helicase